MAKTSKHTTLTKAKGKIPAPQWPIHRALYGDSKIHLARYIEDLAEDLIEWVYKEKENPSPQSALKVEDFFDTKRIPRMVYVPWFKRFPKLQEANDTAKDVLGRIRESGAIHYRYNPAVIMRVQRLYSPEWEQVFKEEAEIKKNVDDRVTELLINMNAFPRCTEVPEKKDKDE